LKGSNRKLLIECIKARERERKIIRVGWEIERFFTDKMDFVRRELEILWRMEAI